MNEEIKEILDRIKKHYVLNEAQDIILLNYITNLQEENKKLKETNEEHRKINGALRRNQEMLHNKNMKLVKVIDELVKFAYGTEMSLGEFKGLFKIAKGEDFIPIIPLEKQLTELKGGSDEKY